MPNSGPQFLHERNPNLHASREVEDVASYLRNGGETIANDPAEKISAYLGFLANKEYVNDGILNGDQESIDRQIAAYVIKAEDVPEGYFDLQARIMHEQGHGRLEDIIQHITPEIRRQMIKAIQADQRAGLGKWVEYLGGEDGGYPDWFKHYTFGSVTKLGNYDKGKKEFLKRSRGTTAPYPELNREALAYVYDVLNKSRVQGERVNGGANDEQLQRVLKGANFGKLYALAVLEVAPTSPELLKEVRGSWTKFNQTSDPRTARRLAGSLQGHGTGWCTAGESTAADQLNTGDFYVYYTRDEDGKDTVPRVAIRMQGGAVAEVRGINTAQELEPEMADITAERLKDLPGGEEYIRKAEDMKRLTAIESKLSTDPPVDLSREEVRFLYELEHPIVGFGYDRDPRIDEIKTKRGERDYLELKVLAIEYIRESFESAYTGYNSVAEQINAMRKPQAPRRLFRKGGKEHGGQLEILGREQVAELFSAKLAEWQSSGLLDHVAERIVSHGEIQTPVGRPNVVVTPDELKQLAHNFAKDQGFKDAYIYNTVYDGYTTLAEHAQLSGYQADGPAVLFELIPNKFSDELGYASLVEHRRTLWSLQVAHPGFNIHVPSVLSGITLWNTLRAMGDQLKSGSVWERTGMRHFDLEPKGSDVPWSVVYRDGRPSLSYSRAGVEGTARFAMG